MWLRSTRALLLLSLLAVGCSSNNIRRAEPIQVEVPAPVAVKKQGPVIPTGINNGFKRAIAMLKQGDIEGARDMLLLLKLQHPGLIGIHLNLALTLYRLDALKEALLEVDEVLRHSPRNHVAYNLRGSILRKLGRFTEARVDYTKAIKIKPDYPLAYLNLAILFDIYLQYWEDSKGYYLYYLELVPEESEKVKLWIQDLDMRIEMAGQQ